MSVLGEDPFTTSYGLVEHVQTNNLPVVDGDAVNLGNEVKATFREGVDALITLSKFIGRTIIAAGMLHQTPFNETQLHVTQSRQVDEFDQWEREE